MMDKEEYELNGKGLFVIINQTSHNFIFEGVDWSEQQKLDYDADEETLLKSLNLKKGISDNLIIGTNLTNSEGDNSFDDFITKSVLEYDRKPSFIMFVLMSHGYPKGVFLLSTTEPLNDLPVEPSNNSSVVEHSSESPVEQSNNSSVIEHSSESPVKQLNNSAVVEHSSESPVEQSNNSSVVEHSSESPVEQSNNSSVVEHSSESPVEQSNNTSVVELSSESPVEQSNNSSAIEHSSESHVEQSTNVPIEQLPHPSTKESIKLSANQPVLQPMETQAGSPVMQSDNSTTHQSATETPPELPIERPVKPANSIPAVIPANDARTHFQPANLDTNQQTFTPTVFEPCCNDENHTHQKDCYSRHLVDDIITPICCTFKGIPKIFIIQTCRGAEKTVVPVGHGDDDAISSLHPDSNDTSDSNNSFQNNGHSIFNSESGPSIEDLFIPRYPDTLVYRACIEGQGSWVQHSTDKKDNEIGNGEIDDNKDNEEEQFSAPDGSWLLAYLSETLEELTISNNQYESFIAYAYTKIVNDDDDADLEKQYKTVSEHLGYQLKPENLVDGWLTNVCKNTTTKVTNAMMAETEYYTSHGQQPPPKPGYYPIDKQQPHITSTLSYPLSVIKLIKANGN